MPFLTVVDNHDLDVSYIRWNLLFDGLRKALLFIAAVVVQLYFRYKELESLLRPVWFQTDVVLV